MPAPSALRRIPRNDGLIARYEELRQQTLERPNATPRGQGLALLLRSGVAGWMAAWAHCVVAVAAAPQERLGDEELFPCAIHQEVTMILAGMVLNGRQEARA